jgi:hypothetical protein
METASLKSFATWARTALIREVTARIAVVLAPASPERVEQPKVVAALEKAVNAAGGGDTGRSAVADRVAYTWFNRIVALRFMDANGYTSIGVVSPQVGVDVGQPEILAEAKRANIEPEVVSQRARETVTGLLNGTRRSDDPQGEAYALLLAEYCRHWNRSMPFMFEHAGDITELLIPANLLADDSVVNRAAKVLTADVCQDVEAIGWLYQFYISERKDEVFAGFKKNKKAGAEEIPAATQLFTPHWIVRYLVENSLGRLWMLNRPSSRLVEQMEYYMSSVDEETGFLKIDKPEDLKIIDPACGSGHMLTYAFDLLYSIYEEEGYAPSEIPGLILANNLYGTEIDPRAGALAAFALTMKARERQRTFFSQRVEPNIRVIEPVSFTPQDLDLLISKDSDRISEAEFWSQFENADVLGSLIQPKIDLEESLRVRLEELSANADDLLAQDVVNRAAVALRNATFLCGRYHIVVANPPYMGNGSMGPLLSEFAKTSYPSTKTDLFAMFIERASTLALRGGLVGMVTMHSWMFLKSYRAMRARILLSTGPVAFAHLGTRAFAELGGEVVSTVAFVLSTRPSHGRRAPFERLVELPTASAKAAALQEAAASETARTYFRSWEELDLVPDDVLSYWLPEDRVRLLVEQVPLADRVPIMAGISTGDNGKYFRYWPEVSVSRIHGNEPHRPWAPHHKGGPERRWFGNVSHVLRYTSQSVAEMQQLPGFRHDGNASYFKAHVGWSALASGAPSFRYIEEGHTFGSGSKALVAERTEMLRALGVLNSDLAAELLEGMSPTLNFEVGHIGRLPTVPKGAVTELDSFVEQAIEPSRQRWDEDELSMGFVASPLIRLDGRLEGAVAQYRSLARERSQRTEELEELIESEVRRIFNVHPRDSAGERLLSLRERPAPVADLVVDLVSYFVGCAFGRYSIDEPGLILADQGATIQDYLARVSSPTFAPDVDNVIPLVDGDWFEDDIVARFRQFLRAAFGEQHFEENLRFVSESLGVTDLRNYFVKSFYQDHIQRYKKRPIYWLFSSPKGSFNALIYMHRYTPSTVSTVLNEYLREYKAKLGSSLQHHERLVAGGGSPRQQAAAQKETDRLRKVLLELDEYEHDLLYPLASQQIQIDLDDGVKVNYPKFGAALKKIPGLEMAE